MTTKIEGRIPNGPAAAALLAGGIGSLAMGLLTTLSEAIKSFGSALNWYNPTGSLSGKSTLAVIIWLAVWYLLAKQWGSKDVDFGKITLIAMIVFWLGVLFTFPPFFDLFVG